MKTHQIALIHESYEKLSPLGEKLAELFYTELFAIDPSLRPLFDGDMRRQYMKLLMMLTLIEHSLHTPDKLLPLVRALGIKHAGYGVRPEHYTPFGNAFLRTLKKVLGTEYSPELRDAWTEALRMLARIMKEAAHENAELE
jgi:hemoglobin-like flavoprotein